MMFFKENATQTSQKERSASIADFPAPTRGWIANENLADSTPKGAAILQNWFPTATTIRMRSGSQLHATIGDESSDVFSIFPYINGEQEELFACTETGIYDVSTGSGGNLYLANQWGDLFVGEDGNIIGSPILSPVVGSLTGGAWVSVQFSTSGGVFLRCVNGADTSLVYDGTTWGTSPAITGVASSDLSFVWAHKNRLFFVERNTLDAWYLPVDNIGGAAVKFPLGGVFNRGGSLLWGASWSIDGSGGLESNCVFVSTEGEVAVYSGSDPSNAADWSLVGVYRVGKPLGAKAFTRAGGDLMIATDIGLIALSQAVQRDLAALAPNAVSYPIETAWNSAVAARGDGWGCEIWAEKQMLIVAPPPTLEENSSIFVVNARTGAWGDYTGWEARCIGGISGRMFYGSSAGSVIEMEVTGADRGAPYTAICLPLFDDFKSPSTYKTAGTARAIFLGAYAPRETISIQRDYSVSFPPSPSAFPTTASSSWGVGVWGVSAWGAGQQKKTWSELRSVRGAGRSLSPAILVTSGSPAPPDLDLINIVITYEKGRGIS